MGVFYLRTKPNLTKREARWAEFLADCDFNVHNRPGAKNLADSLSRRSDLQHPSDECIDSPQINAIEHALEINYDVAKAIASGYQFDKELAPIIERL